MAALKQEAPDPEALRLLVGKLEYRPGWSFSLMDTNRGQGCAGLTLNVKILTMDSYRPELGWTYERNHLMPVPAVNYDETAWSRWLFDQCLAVERHECGEFFRINGERVFKPRHGFGSDPYVTPLR